MATATAPHPVEDLSTARAELAEALCDLTSPGHWAQTLDLLRARQAARAGRQVLLEPPAPRPVLVVDPAQQRTFISSFVTRLTDEDGSLLERLEMLMEVQPATDLPGRLRGLARAVRGPSS